jgi:hypothetical protein
MKRIAIDKNTDWIVAHFPFLPDAKGEDDIEKGAYNAVALAKAMSVPVEDVRQLFTLGYAKVVETDDGLAFELIFPAPAE